MCAESLQSRVCEMLHRSAGRPDRRGPANDTADDTGDDQFDVVANYLQMIQDEAFRCKEITEKLLDFSRTGPTKRQATDLTQLVADVVAMVGHLGQYQGKRVEFAYDRPLVAEVNTQEIKQIVLNLLTNALDSLDEDGTVAVRLCTRAGMAEVTFDDDGCGMEPGVLEHVFEPFFTRRRCAQGTGLGLSITHRIVTDHGGTIEVESPGPGRGTTFIVRLPLTETSQELEDQYHTARTNAA